MPPCSLGPLIIYANLGLTVRDKSPSPGKPKRMVTVKRAKPSKLSPGERKVLAAIKTALRGKLR